MKRQELSDLISLSGKELDRLLRQIDPQLVGAKEIPDNVAEQILEGFKQATGTQPAPPQPPAPAHEGMGGALAETQGEQLAESRQKIDAILPELDKILLQKTAQSAVTDADLNALVYQSVFESRSTDNRLAFVQQKIGQLNHQQAAKLEGFDPYQMLQDAGVTNPQQTYEAFCEWQRSLNALQSTQSVPVDAMGKQNTQAKLEVLKAIYTGN
jgi:hypothetical protein